MSVLDKLGLSEACFETTWQGRLAAIVSTLDDDHIVDWTELAKRIAVTPAAVDESGKAQEFTNWVQALESALIDKKLLTEAELSARVEQIHAEKHEHDQTHDHDHD